MHPTDDTVRPGAQAREDSYIALLEAGALPGIEHFGMRPPRDVEPGTLVLQRVAKSTALGGGYSGATMALWMLRHIPEHAMGNVILAFDGWADDPRELYEIPVVVEFCRGMLLGAGEKPSMDWAHQVLGMLMDERRLGLVLDETGEDVVDPDMVNVPGGMWLVRHAHPDLMIERVNGQVMHDIKRNLRMFEVLAGE